MIGVEQQARTPFANGDARELGPQRIARDVADDDLPAQRRRDAARAGAQADRQLRQQLRERGRQAVGRARD